MKQKELEKLFEICLKEQENIGLEHKDKIEIFFNKAPNYDVRCGTKANARTVITKDNGCVILINKQYFERIPLKEQKELIHHELVHCIKNEKGENICHIQNWKEFSEISNLIKNVYGYNPLTTYDNNCFFDKKNRYNFLAICPKCGQTNYYYLEKKESIEPKKCHNCGEMMNNHPIKRNYNMEQKELEELLETCLNEQKAIGIKHETKINIYFDKAPGCKTRCNLNENALTVFLPQKNILNILVRKQYFERLCFNQQKELLHHELIHCIKQGDGSYIMHKKDWKTFMDFSNKVNKAYGLYPLTTYGDNCFTSDRNFRYNFFVECPKCGQKLYAYFEEKSFSDIKGNLKIKCHNCGKTIYQNNTIPK